MRGGGTSDRKTVELRSDQYICWWWDLGRRKEIVFVNIDTLVHPVATGESFPKIVPFLPDDKGKTHL